MLVSMDGALDLTPASVMSNETVRIAPALNQSPFNSRNPALR
jgi:hypothetical protein